MLLSSGIIKSKIFPYRIKSDRINALRKQYDAFLEEDKKRKERNEYILCRLDKMRYSNALVPTRYKPITLLNGPTLGIYRGFPEYAFAREYQVPVDSKIHLMPAMPHTNLDDESLINDITKKFILIPKLRSDESAQSIPAARDLEYRQFKDPAQNISTSKDATSTSNENSDWKSKYEILNILKKEEPIKLKSGGDLAEPNANNEAIFNNALEQQNNVAVESAINIPNEKDNTYLDEQPEKDFSSSYNHLENTEYNHNVTNILHTYDDKPNGNVTADSIPVNSAIPIPLMGSDGDKHNANVTADSITTDSAIPISTIGSADPITAINYQLENTKLDNSDVHNMASEVVHQNYEISPETETTILYDNHLPLQNLENNYDNVTATTEIVNNEEDYSQYNQSQIGTDESREPNAPYMEMTGNAYNNQVKLDADGIVQDPDNYLANEYTEQPENVENIQYYAQNEEIIKHDVSNQPEERVLQQGNNELYKLQSQNEVEGLVDPAEITTVDDSQNDSTIVYQEYPDEQIDSAIQEFEREQAEMFYSEQTGNEYQEDASAYNQDYTSQSQDNQDYAYYEGAQPAIYEEQHTAEINENEDVTQRYDLHYEQQYVEMNAGDSGNQTSQPEVVGQQNMTQNDEQSPQETVYVQESDNENYKPSADDYNQSQSGIPEGTDQTQLGYEQVEYEQNYENHEQIQQALDTEEGYNIQTSDTNKEDLTKEKPILA